MSNPVTEEEYNKLPPASRWLIKRTLLAARRLEYHPLGVAVLVRNSAGGRNELVWNIGSRFDKKLVLTDRNYAAAKVDTERGLIVFKTSKHIHAFRPLRLENMIKPETQINELTS